MGSSVSKDQIVVLNSTVATHSGLRHHYPSLGLLQNLPFLPSLPTVPPRAVSSCFCSSLIFHWCPDSLRIKLKNLKCLLWSLEGALPLMTLHSTHTSLIWTIFPPTYSRVLFSHSSFLALPQIIQSQSHPRPLRLAVSSASVLFLGIFTMFPSHLFQAFFEMAPVWWNLFLPLC